MSNPDASAGTTIFFSKLVHNTVVLESKPVIFVQKYTTSLFLISRVTMKESLYHRSQSLLGVLDTKPTSTSPAIGTIDCDFESGGLVGFYLDDMCSLEVLEKNIY
jgi:hypothetical protein